ncbi:MAG: LuxR C-terminal-related transcriptional regulator [Sphingobacterium sp.]|jgi:tetratricopeptide (TPR) repeat protein/DNA-binding CsgD family transcriptional regulator|nr:LuxR C-terminal-related transcriptional regulator [Sphingobacterium sp.]
MKISSSTILFIYIIVLLLSGCQQYDSSSILLEKALKFAETNPSAALKFIDSIYDPENLNNKQQMQYIVAHTQIYHKNYLSIAEDSLIFKAVEYYKKHQEDSKQVAITNFYAGAVVRSQRKFDQAMLYYKNAETHAKRSRDTTTLGLLTFNIADLLAEQGLYQKALYSYSKAEKYYINNPQKRSLSFSSIGRMYLFDHKADSAFYYFHQGLRLAKDIKDLNLQRQLAESLAVAYEQVGKFTEAREFLNNSFSLNTDSTRLARYYLNFGLLYAKIPLADSTAFYAEKLKLQLPSIKDNYLLASALSFLSTYKKEQKHFSEAFDLQAERMKIVAQIMKERENQSVLKIEKRYNYEQIKKQYYKSLSTKQRWIIILMGVVILGGILFAFYYAKYKNREIAIQTKMETLSDMNRDLETMVQKKKIDLRRDLLWRFDVAKKFLMINNEINKKGKSTSENNLMLKQFNSIVYDRDSPDEQWDTLHQVFKNARPGYSEKIKKKYPGLTETEFRIGILTYADLNIKEIALILKQSPNTVQTKRTSLRKKLNIPNGGDIADFIDRLID